MFNVAEISWKLLIFFKPIFCENFEIAEVQKDANPSELEKCCQTHILLQNFVLIQPRTNPLSIQAEYKFAPIIIQKSEIFGKIFDVELTQTYNQAQK